MNLRLPFILILQVLPIITYSQKIDNLSSFRDFGNDHYFRFNYDNDFFASTDQYYTQGYSFEFVSSILEKNPLNYILVKPKDNQRKYGLALEHIGFTPTSILSDAVLYGDRPFAAAIMLKSFAIGTDSIRKSRFVSSLNLGIIGPGAFGGDTQTAIHRWTGNPTPKGWQHQIKNDVVLNYEMSYEKQLIRIGDLFSLHSATTLRVGTLFTNASAGLIGSVGLVNNPFKPKPKKFNCYIYAQPLVNAIGYDATLQGGLFNRRSPYAIGESHIERLTAQINFGAVLTYKNLYFEYSRAKLTREFDTGSPAKWGGFKIGLKF